MAPVFDEQEVRRAAAERTWSTPPVMMRLSDRGASGAAWSPVGQYHPGAEGHPGL